MISDVIAYIHLLNLTKLGKLNKEIFIKEIKVLLKLSLVKRTDCFVSWIVVYVGDEDSLRKGRFNVFPGTALSVTTSTDFEVKRAIDSLIDKK
jgi:hypothetical protein